MITKSTYLLLCFTKHSLNFETVCISGNDVLGRQCQAGADKDDLFSVIFSQDELERLVQFLSPQEGSRKKTDLQNGIRQALALPGTVLPGKILIIPLSAYLQNLAIHCKLPFFHAGHLFCKEFHSLVPADFRRLPPKKRSLFSPPFPRRSLWPISLVCFADFSYCWYF